MDDKFSIRPEIGAAGDESMLAGIANAFEACTGVEFFQNLVCFLARLLGVDFAYVGRLTGAARDQVQTLSVCVRGEIVDNIHYDIAPTPCLIVVNTGFSSYNRDVQRLFPDDRIAAEIGVESYIGIALRGADGVAAGLLTVMDSKPFANPRSAEWVLRIFSERAAAELDRLRSEAARVAAEQRFRTTLMTPIVGIAVTSPDKRWLEVNDRLCEILGYTRDELVGMRWDHVSYGEDLHSNLILFEQALGGELDSYSLDKRFVRKDGRLVSARIAARCVRSHDGQVEYFVLLVDDTSERLQIQERLQYLSRHDSLTRLPNRSVLMERFDLALSRAGSDGRITAVLCVGLDRFRHVNELLGHRAGDLLLELAARRLASCLRPGDTVARLGGDEFAIVLPDIVRVSDVSQVANRILAAYAEPYLVNGRELFLGASIGIARYPEDAQTAEDLLRCADAALNRAKGEGKNNYYFFSSDIGGRGLDDLALEADLRRALDRDQLRLYYQPLVHAANGNVVGVEALLRWNHPQLGVLAPAGFLSLAEEIGLTLPIGSWVLRSVADQARLWRQSIHPSLRVSVNLSGRQFMTPAFVDSVGPLLSASGLPPSALELEITEDVIMRDAAASLERLGMLHDMGVRFAIDDFGTGYSSLSYLTRLRLHTLKIDKSFVRDLEQHGQAGEIVRTIVAMGHSLQLQVVAEGVENARQLAILRAQGCDMIQGYYYSRPLPVEGITQLLREWTPRDGG